MADIDEKGVLVIGLGRFGTAIATTLDGLGRDVLVVERDPDLAQKWSSRLRVIQGDATSMEVLEEVGAEDFRTAVVGVGTSLEASVLVTANLVDLGTTQIWAKAISRSHGRILRRIGAHHVVYPEFDAGQRVAHMVSGRMLDYIEMEDGFSIVKMRPPRDIQGFTIAQSRIRERFGVRIIGVKAAGQAFEYASADTRIGADDVIIVSGDSELLEEFATR
ncbi:trk system potassium uptake protein TrkA [Actinobaculum suis]|uniref:Trk system potassium uptake protein TrkA n=1 Tax=Actinobaculum suis TaxID=1657 RepID=A0A0K9ESY5_9ACTO|nr:TrkA family potassium uptake protein [Actinobaculum suis]KMY22971.1 potassium transporter [Actinobaculum suis]MDY5152941.1 TrkA family potassium uptake protein [Actinobaculum suis]OCA94591.1 potassium transporter [Actinobaculum suis]OCA95002.1 potassium transporter [Actinobaculum suis]SDE36253.1 trk system potassium uptake protein TrkA [Actinobaculum suis]